MPTLQGTPEIRAFIDWLSGKDDDADAAIKATARHLRAHYSGPRPCVGSSEPARWPSIEAMRNSVRWYGPNCTVAQFDIAYATFVAS